VKLETVFELIISVMAGGITLDASGWTGSMHPVMNTTRINDKHVAMIVLKIRCIYFFTSVRIFSYIQVSS
jgi:hypothetical protein